MANIKVSEMPETIAANIDDLIMIIQGGENKKITEKNLLGDSIVVSPTEPVGNNRRKVWFRKGKNLFNYKAGMYLNAFINTSSKKIEESNKAQGHILSYMKCSPNTTYTLSKKAGHSFRVATFTKVPAWGVSYNNTVANHTGTTITITTGENDNYLGFVCFALTDGDTGDYIDMYSTLQVEQGSKATSYEAYIEPKIYVRNSNGVYEEFMKKSEEVYSTEEQRIGTWINGKPLYRKIVNAQFGTVVQGTETTVEVNLKNVDFILVDKYWLDRKTASSSINQGYAADALYLGYTSFNNSNTTLRFRTKQSWVSNTAIYAIIEYTKTTD